MCQIGAPRIRWPLLHSFSTVPRSNRVCVQHPCVHTTATPHRFNVTNQGAEFLDARMEALDEFLTGVVHCPTRHRTAYISAVKCTLHRAWKV